MAPRVCIIGGGAIGLSTAVQLTERGVRDVTLVEAEGLASGSSSRSAGFVESQYVDPLDVESRARAMHFFRRLQREHGLHIKEIGYLRLAHDPKLLETYEQSVQLQREFGIDHASVVDRDEIQRLFPDMRCDDLAGALWGPRDGRIDGPTYCGIMAGLATSACGAYPGRPTGQARGVDPGRRPPRGDRAGSDRVRRGRERCGRLGAEGRQPARRRDSRRAVRHQIAILQLERPLDYVLPMMMDYVPRTGTSGLYAGKYDRPDLVLAGLHTEEILGSLVNPDGFNLDADPAYVAETRERLLARMPGLRIAGVNRAWAGIYPTSPDGQPQVGPLPGDPSIVLAVGGGGSGIQLSPIVGALAADWIAFGEPRSLSNAAAFAPGRPGCKDRSGGRTSPPSKARTR